MKNREKKAKIANYSLTVFFYAMIVPCIVLAVISYNYGVSCVPMVLVGIFSLLAGIFWTAVSKRIHDNYEKMYADAPLIEKNYARTREEVQKMNFFSDEHFSSLGYEFYEYRDDFELPDNCHIEFDKTNECIVVYTLLPFSFKQYKFSDFKSVTSVKEKQYSRAGVDFILLNIVIKFSDGYTLTISVSDNKPFIDDPSMAEYRRFINEANIVIEKIENLIGEQNES